MRTNIFIEDTLMETAMRVSGMKTKKDVVDIAMREFVERRIRKDLSELKGKINFEEDYDYKSLREDN